MNDALSESRYVPEINHSPRQDRLALKRMSSELWLVANAV